MLGAFLQITVVAGLTVYLFNHTNNMALQYAQLAERNANQRTVDLIRIEHNELQVQFSDERSSMRDYVNNRVDQKVSQALREGK